MYRLYLLNSPVLTDFGTYAFRPMALDEVRAIVSKSNIVSAIGHQATADVISKDLNVPVSVNRQVVHLAVGDAAIVLRLNSRLAEGTVLNAEELSLTGYSYGLLRRLA